ncbi:kelch-like protein 24, partial [Saccoglossus kowalevskii]|uniref:Kelch-like protein 24-like n=1 Tax=Saccoglossus kowalevskii TaxID=10224 RepID=A0ABM0M4J2_SACKO
KASKESMIEHQEQIKEMVGNAGLRQDEIFISPEHFSSLLTQLNNYRHQCDMTDVVICVGERQFPCHRAILAGCSEFFHQLLQTLPAYAESKVQKLVIEDIYVDTVDIFLNYVYSGVAKITADNVEQLLDTAKFFQVQRLTEACTEFLNKHCS